MQRTTIKLDDLGAQLEEYMADGYDNRSEVIRDLLRAGLQDQLTFEQPDKQCVGAAVYVYDSESCLAISVVRGTGTGLHSHVHVKRR